MYPTFAVVDVLRSPSGKVVQSSVPDDVGAPCGHV
jgi:hypothetical protein